MTAQFVIIDGVPYSPKHPKALALQRATIAPEATPTEPELPSSQSGLRVAKRLRQSSKPKMNKLETEWMERLMEEYHDETAGDISRPRSQALRFQLANGVTLTPDFISMAWYSGIPGKTFPTAWEVKGTHAWEDSLIKLKVAATMWPSWVWILCWKKDGQWQTQTILP